MKDKETVPEEVEFNLTVVYKDGALRVFHGVTSYAVSNEYVIVYTGGHLMSAVVPLNSINYIGSHSLWEGSNHGI